MHHHTPSFTCYIPYAMSSLKPLLLCTLLCFVTLMVHGQTVTFSVNMEHAFLDPGDKIVVRGSIPGLGNWEKKGQVQLKEKRNSAIFTGTITAPNIEEEVLYKFVILRKEGTEQWEERGNRTLSTLTAEPVWFGDREGPGIAQTVVQVTFQLDLRAHAMDGVPAQGVALMGAHAPLSFELETGRTELIETSDGIWETTVAFPFGTPHDVPFKFAWLNDGQWMWEWRPGHSNHVFVIDDRSTEQSIQLVYDVEQPGVVGVEGSSGDVDNYEAVLARLPERQRAHSRYTYEKAMQELTNGQHEAAKATYAEYKAGHPGGEEIDDFHYRMSHQIKKSQGLEAANRYIETQLATETVSERRAYYGYLKGELELSAGNRNQARRQFKTVLKEGGWALASQYASDGLVHSYLTESDPDSIKKGVELLEGQAARAPQEERRKYARILERAYRTADMPEKRRAALGELARTGTPAQQYKGKIAQAKVFLEEGQASEALGLLDITEFSGQIPKGMDVQRVRLTLQAYHQLEMHAELATLYEQYQTAWPNDAYGKRLGKLNEQARIKLGEGWSPTPGQEMNSATPDSTNN